MHLQGARQASLCGWLPPGGNGTACCRGDANTRRVGSALPGRFRLRGGPVRQIDRRRGCSGAWPRDRRHSQRSRRLGTTGCGVARGHARRRPQAVHLPARPDRHAHAPDGQRARDGRPQRLLQAHAGGAGCDRTGQRPRNPAGRVTGARDVGTYIAWVDRDLRDAINQGDAVGPRMQVAVFT